MYRNQQFYLPPFDENQFYQMPYEQYYRDAPNFQQTRQFYEMPRNISGMRRTMNFQSMLQTTTKAVSTMNQVIPLVYQIAPIINNARNAFSIFRAVRSYNDIDDAQIDQAITIENEKKEENQDVVFENML